MNLNDLRKSLDEKKIGSVELTKQYLDRIKAVDEKINSYITVCEEDALIAAENAQKLIDSGNSKPLTGIPISIKDNICTLGTRTTCGSHMLDNFIPTYDATVIEKLKNQGFVMLGKTNMDEFAMGGSSQTSYFGGVKNPHDVTRVTGGSSGGAAASVAADLCAAALGSDTGGSVRQPASFCGVTGLKPTYGRVSRWGLIAFASSLDQIGPVAKSAYDTGFLLNAISGVDVNDATTGNKEIPDFTSSCGMDLKGMKIGLPKEFFSDGIDPSVKTAVLKAADVYKSMGCELIDCSLPTLEYAVSAYYLISSAEAASNLSRFDGIKYGHRSGLGDSFNDLIKNSRGEGFGNEVKRRILLGNYALSSGYYDAYYKNALRIRAQLKKEYSDIFEKCDVIITPTAPSAAYKIGFLENDPVKMYLADICTVTANIAGLPGISTTCGYDENNMPIGISILGKAYDEKTIIGVADSFEKTFKRQEAVL